MVNKQGAGPRKQGRASVRVRGLRDVPRYFSDKDLKPINELSEAQLIAEGYRPPLKITISFEKSEKDREAWAEVHQCRKGPSGGSSKGIPANQIQHRLTIHLVNNHKRKDFITTRSFNLYPSEVPFVLDKYHIPEKSKIVSKYYYRGEAKRPS